MIVDSHVIVGNKREPGILYPVSPSSNILQEQCQNQDTDSDTVKIHSISITPGSLVLSFYRHTYFPLTPSPP